MTHQPLIRFGESLIGEGNEATREMSGSGKRRKFSEFIRFGMVYRARQLLGYSDLAIDDIARHCGFRNNSDLTQSFVPIAGVTPRRYRYQRKSDRGASG